ncbi:MAG: ABC transporter ATP-binding protein, partial [Spirochaetota bacterium]
YSTIYEESAKRRIGVAEKLRKLPLAFFAEKNLSDLTSTIMNDNTELETVFSHAIPQLFASLISLTLISIGLLFYNWQMALALFWVIPIATLMVLGPKKMFLTHNQKIYDSKRAVTEDIQEGLETIQEIKSYNQEDKYMAKLSESLASYEKTLTKVELLGGAILNSAQGILKLGMPSVIILGSYLISAGTIGLITYLMFLIIASRIYEPINEVFMFLAMLFFLDIRLNRMQGMESLPIQTGTTDFTPESYDVSFDNVHFSYESGKKVLDGVSFTAKQGEVTALIGPSGGGKSTAAKLTTRFWDIDSGKICLGSTDIATVEPEALLRYYAVVFQDVVLFNASVMDNIRVGKKDASEQEVYRVAQLAQCDEFVKQLPDAYETILGENGETLSGGERQRISIARALLKDAPIVLLDEATASLDAENETKIQAGLSELIKNKTVLIIAHRMRTIANADKIVVLSKGEVVEMGRPQELLKQKGIYAGMANRQLLTV